MSSKIKHSSSVGILAGEGALPHQLVQYCIENDIQVCLIQFDQCQYTSFPNIPILKTRMEKVGKIFSFFRQHSVTDIVMIGNLVKPNLLSLRPDWYGLKILYKIAGSYFQGDNTLLTTLRNHLEDEGFVVRGVDYYLTHLTCPAGCITKTKCQNDYSKGIEQSLSHGQKDKGQSILMHKDMTFSYEDKNGTSHLIQKECKDGSILIKMAKPQQDMDIDRPTVGIETLKKIKEMNGAGIIVQANSVLMIDKETMIDFANHNNMFIEVIDA